MTLVRDFQNFLFPPFCLCCRQPVEEDRSILCKNCFRELQLIDPLSHSNSPDLEGISSCFDDGPVVRSLITGPASLIAPFMVLQWNALGWPLPDFVVPTPGDWFSRGSDRWEMRQQIAHAVAAILGRQSTRALALNRSLLPTPYLSLEEQQKNCDESALRIRHPHRLVNTTVLLIHDILTTGMALHVSASALRLYGVRAVWGMCVA